MFRTGDKVECVSTHHTAHGNRAYIKVGTLYSARTPNWSSSGMISRTRDLFCIIEADQASGRASGRAPLFHKDDFVLAIPKGNQEEDVEVSGPSEYADYDRAMRGI